MNVCVGQEFKGQVLLKMKTLESFLPDHFFRAQEKHFFSWPASNPLCDLDKPFPV